MRLEGSALEKFTRPSLDSARFVYFISSPFSFRLAATLNSQIFVILMDSSSACAKIRIIIDTFIPVKIYARMNAPHAITRDRCDAEWSGYGYKCRHDKIWLHRLPFSPSVLRSHSVVYPRIYRLAAFSPRVCRRRNGCDSPQGTGRIFGGFIATHKSIRFHHKVPGGRENERCTILFFPYATSRTRSAKADSPVRDLQIYELELICNLRVADPCRLQR